ncbi:MAG: hypothetical protein QXY65_02935 [Candidatus Methanomethylicaceae archaeon]
MEKATFRVFPFSIEVDGTIVNIYEVLKTKLISGDEWYHVVVEINYKGIKSKRYTLDVRNINNLINKLKIEIDKIKLIEYAYGINEVRRVIG